MSVTKAANLAPIVASCPASSAASIVGASLDRGATRGVGASAAGSRPRSSVAARADSPRSRGSSGVARRTASGGRGADGLVMSGRSSGRVAPNSGNSAEMMNAGAGAAAAARELSAFMEPEKRTGSDGLFGSRNDKSSGSCPSSSADVVFNDNSRMSAAGVSEKS